MALILRLTKGSKLTWEEVDANFEGLADGSLIEAGAIITASLANSAVTADKIAANAVVTAKIADGNVTSAKLAANLSLTGTTSMAAGNVTGALAVGGNLTVTGTITGNLGSALPVAQGGTGQITEAEALGEMTQALTEDTSPDLIADFLSEYDASADTGKKLRLATLLGLSCPPGQGVLLNGKVTFTPSSNALIVAIKGMDGNDPSASNPVFAAFRSATLTDGSFTVRKITSALSFTLSSGSTSGHASAVACHLFAYLIDNSGTVEIAVSNLPPDYPGVFGATRLCSTTAEGGAGGADSATGIYSTTARSNVPWVCVAKALSTQATAGTWASAMTQVDQAPFVVPSNPFYMENSVSQTWTNGAYVKAAYDTKTDPDGVCDVATNRRFRPNIAGPFQLNLVSTAANAVADTGVVLVAIYKNGSIAAVTQTQQSSGSGSAMTLNLSATLWANGTSDYFEGYQYFGGGGSTDNGGNGNGVANNFSGSRVVGG